MAKKKVTKKATRRKAINLLNAATSVYNRNVLTITNLSKAMVDDLKKQVPISTYDWPMVAGYLKSMLTSKMGEEIQKNIFNGEQP